MTKLNTNNAGIGTLSEKGVHSYLKDRFADKAHQEIKVGNYIADIKIDNQIIEIQSAQTKKLLPKIEYYLKHDYKVTIVLPIPHHTTKKYYSDEKLIRVVNSRVAGTFYDAFKELYWIYTYLENPNFSIKLVLVDIAITKNKLSNSRKYSTGEKIVINDYLFALDLFSKLDYNKFVEDLPEKFSAKDFISHSKSRSKYLRSGLQQLEKLGLISKSKNGRSYEYRKIKNNNEGSIGSKW